MSQSNSEGFFSKLKKRIRQSSTVPIVRSTAKTSVSSNSDSRGIKNVDPKAISKNIDKQLQKDKVKSINKFRILLLGGSECGKTTIFKQLRILHLNGFTDVDKLWYKTPIRRNIIQALSQLLLACTEMKIVHQISLQNAIKDFDEFRHNINQMDAEIEIPPEMASIMAQIWKSSGIQMAYQRRWSFYLLDSAKYFLDSITKISAEKYLPDVQDIIQCRFPTIGTEEIEFRYQDIDFSLVDVGGQRTERRKWINFFDNVQMMLFVAALSDYDLQDAEDVTQNRLTANRHIFKTLAQSSFFKQAAIVLFLNKFDTFKEKISYSPLTKYYPEYKGERNADEASKYLGDMFARHVRDKHKFFMFCTTAVDTRNIDFMFGSAVTHIINQNLQATGSC